MLTTLLLTPMMLATEPFQLQMPERSYSHESQVSTWNGELTNVLKARLTYQNTQTFSGSHSDTDTNSYTDSN